jgi:LPXTG-site transpeptidase (sortase) family protein
VGARIGVLTVPRLDTRLPVYEGTAQRVLAKGPGHYRGTSLPGQAGTVAIAGHRVTHTHPFLKINLIRRGDVIVMTTRRGTFRYRVNAMHVVLPTATWVLFRGRKLQRLVLTACHPPHSSRYRYVVMATRIP